MRSTPETAPEHLPSLHTLRVAEFLSLGAFLALPKHCSRHCCSYPFVTPVIAGPVERRAGSPASSIFLDGGLVREECKARVFLYHALVMLTLSQHMAHEQIYPSRPSYKTLSSPVSLCMITLEYPLRVLLLERSKSCCTCQARISKRNISSQTCRATLQAEVRS